MKFERSYRLRVAVVVILTLSALPCFAGEVAVLKNGFSIRHERREILADITRLYVSTDKSSYVDIPTAEIDHFEAAPGSPIPTSRLSSSAIPQAGRNAQSAPAASLPAANLDDVISVASDHYRLDPDLVASVIKAESGFNVRAISPKGAQGLMQLMPGTASGLGVPNAFDARANVEGGTRYLRELLERYNFDLVKALAAYNAGPQRVEQFGGVPPFYETRAYVARVVKDFNKKKAAQQNSPAVQSTAKKTSMQIQTSKPRSSPAAQASVSIPAR